MKETALDRFLRYAKIDTQSSEESNTYPSTEKQLDLLKLLAAELKELGVPEVSIDEHGLVMATLPGNLPAGHPGYGLVPAIGFIAHADTSPSASGKDVKPLVFEYQGGDIQLTGNPSVVIRESENPALAENIGRTIVTTDGTTLLGADNKAGIAIIMTAVQNLIADPSILHGPIAIGFTADEEVGAGTRYFDLDRFGARFAYTVDGDRLGEINKETFSADLAVITVHGRNIHPGTAKGIMVNSIRAMADIILRMPKDIAPETTEGYEPYIHPHALSGAEAESNLKILLRDFNTAGLDRLRQKLEVILAEVQALHPRTKIELKVINQYRNMKDHMGTDLRVVDYLEEAVRGVGLEPHWIPIRGGTDGSRLTEKGLPTPNIFTGGVNFHGPTEWLSVHAMEKSVETVVQLARLWAEKSAIS
jgi:tripeptide aminopeptidase